MLSNFRKTLALLLVGLLPLHAMAVSLVSGQLNSNSSTTAAVTTATLIVTLPAHATAGNAIAVGFAYTASAGTVSLTTITDDQANTYTINQNNARTGFSNNAGVATIVSLANTPQTISVTVGSTASGSIQITAEAYEVSGATAVDVSGTGTTGSTTALNATFTTTAANDFAFASVTSSGGPTWTQNNGWTQDFASTSSGTWMFHNILSASGANSLNMTSSTANFDLWNVATFKGSATGAVLAGAATDAVTATGMLVTGAAPFAPIALDNPSHVNGSDQVGMGGGAGSGTGDSAFVGFSKLKVWAADVNTMAAQLYPVRSSLTPTTGFSVAVTAGVTLLVLNPAGTLATGAFALPTFPSDNQPFEAMTSQTITALTVTTSDGTTLNGAPTTFAANTSVKWRFQTALNAWFREQ